MQRLFVSGGHPRTLLFLFSQEQEQEIIVISGTVIHPHQIPVELLSVEQHQQHFHLRFLIMLELTISIV
jgi:hypothetical protein